MLACVAAGGCVGERSDDRFRETGQIIAMSGGDGGVAAACVTCHGLHGEGDGALSPRLAGLDVGYLQRQLDDYVNGRRDHVPMRTVARKLSLDDRGKVSAYYAGLPAPPPIARPTDAEGNRLYAACVNCHGSRGEGRGPANPPLSAQPAAYVEAQLAAWREGRRYNDPLGEMRHVSRRFSPEQARAVSVHAVALPGPHPR
ncbi:c-type cytochrome [Sphingomonas montanisoli]|uniref:C-type cytochrome n=1 Tax=Sphingomonas montanisoli TaxID=2606412 RepID=A0A5D9C6J2_9SPHN|nr:c-type cytochrome [Sphingomonas montanisoli]TZG27299.1 c-type cytochrome [Sphingomonas montanisoli]